LIFGDIGGDQTEAPSLGSALNLSWSEKARTIWVEGPTTWWTSNIYSLGPSFRQLLNLPRWIPLDFMSDHGVTFGRNFFVCEIMRRRTFPSTYLSWFGGQVAHASSRLGGDLPVEVVGCPHPWTAANRHYESAGLSQDGCLAFVPHSVIGGVPDMGPIYTWKEFWKELPKALQPTALCLSIHELKLETLAALRQLDLPLFTVGNPNSAFFMHRFYNLRRRFKFSISPVFGSEACYISDLGWDHFLFGEWNTGGSRGPGVDNWQDKFRQLAKEEPDVDLDLWEEADSVFREISPNISSRFQMSDHLLGKHFRRNLGLIRERVSHVTPNGWWRSRQRFCR